LRRVTRWLRLAGFEVEKSHSVVRGRWGHWHRATLGMMRTWWALEHSVVARQRAGDTVRASKRRNAPRPWGAASPSE